MYNKKMIKKKKKEGRKNNFQENLKIVISIS